MSLTRRRDAWKAAHTTALVELTRRLDEGDREMQVAARSYCRAIAIRISLSLSWMRSPETSTVTLCNVPVNGKGDA